MDHLFGDLKRSCPQQGLLRCEGLRRLFYGEVSIEQLEQIATDLTKLIHLLWLGQMRTFRRPIADRRESPTFAVVRHPPHEHPQQLQAFVASVGGDPKLQEQAAALESRAPSREVEGKIERFRFIPAAGLGVVSPGAQVRLRCRELATYKGDGRCEGPDSNDAVHRLPRVHTTPITQPSLTSRCKGCRYGCGRFTTS